MYLKARGRAHIHGVGWIQKEYLEQLDITGDLKDHPIELPKLIDQLITCKKPLPGENDTLRDIMEVQEHYHAKSCRKYGTNCRYNIPRLPSPKTIIARPNPPHFEKLNQKEKEDFLMKSSDILTKGREILEHAKKAGTLDEISRKALKAVWRMSIISMSDPSSFSFRISSIQESRLGNSFRALLLPSFIASK